MTFGADSYALDTFAVITLSDCERNTDIISAQTLMNDVFIQTSLANTTKVKMVETGADTGIFTGSIMVASSGGTTEFSQIQASEGNTLTISYRDEVNTTGSSKQVTDMALVTIETPTPTVSPTPSPTSTPPCEETAHVNAEPEPLKLGREGIAEETVTVTCETGTPLPGKVATATVRKGGRSVSVSPSSAVTDVNGQATFTITATRRTGNAKVRFETDGLRDTITIKVRKK